MTGENQLHPSHDELLEFGLGKLEDDAHERVEQHVENCGECCKILLDLPGDTVVSLLRDPKADTSVSPDLAVGEPKEMGTVEHLPGAVAASSHDLPPELRDHSRYRVFELLGRGGMGDVYKAEHRVMHRTLALKVINRELVRNPTAIERFRREAQAAARLDHPNIVTAYDAEQAGDLHLLAMEFVEGTDLAEVVRQRGPLPIDEACSYIQQAAEGLQHAYKAGMVHRDIKPQNLMLTTDGKIKILDFGLAGLLVDAVLVDEDSTFAGINGDSPPKSLTAIGTMMGTPDYVAPEQAQDARSADIRADIYALGCTLYYLLTGQPPFPIGSATDKVRAHQRQEPIPVRRLRPDVPLDLELVLLKMMAKKPTQRYRRPAEVAEILQPFVDGSLACEDSSIFFYYVKSWARSVIKTAILLSLGAVIWIVSDRGRIEIESEVNDVKVVFSQDGREVKIIDLQTDTRVRWLSSGNYEVRLKSDRNDVKLSHDKLTIKRWGKRIARVTRVEPSAHDNAGSQAAAAAPDPKQQASPRSKNSDASNPWLDIFDGRSLDGWENDGSATWTVQDGLLVGRGRPGHGRLLYTRKPFEDLEVRAECRINAEGNSGIYVRTNFGSQFDNGYEAQISTRADQVTWTGGIWPQTRFKRRVVKDGDWFVLEGRVLGNVISVKVNGEQTVRYTDDQQQFRSGMIGLQAWGEPTEVSFRRIQVRRLDASGSKNLATDSSLEDSPAGKALSK